MAKPILVFDSGVGGLSILKELHSHLPEQSYYYLFDNARLPYGELAEDELITGSVALISQVVAEIDARLVVVACNTASTLVLEQLRQSLNIPVVGVVPAIKPAALLSKTKHIALLATPGTIQRDYTHKLIQEFADDCHVELIGSSELVHIAEQKLAGEPVALASLEKIIAPIKAQPVDVVVLGCTHFPLLAPEIEALLQKSVVLLDSSKAIAQRVRYLIGEQGELSRSQKDKGVIALYTGMINEGLEKTLATYGCSSSARVLISG